MYAFAGNRVARAYVVGVDVAGAFAEFTIIAVRFWAAVVTCRAAGTASTVITWQTVTTDFIAFLVDFATGGKIVGGHWQWAGTNKTVRGRSNCGIAVVALLAEFTVIAYRTVSAVLQIKGIQTGINCTDVGLCLDCKLYFNSSLDSQRSSKLWKMLEHTLCAFVC